MPGDSRHLPDAVPPAARERVVERLTRHFAADELTEDALETHLQRVYAATTVRELDDILASLPAVPAPQPSVARAVTAISATLAGQERKLTSVVPRELTVRAHLGYVELDLTQATFEPGVTTIDVRALLGYVQIRLPVGIRVENSGRALLGFFGLRRGTPSGAQDPTGASPVVRITGEALLGFAEGLIGHEG